MILLTCTHCRARLEIDDAFAGGVCRCMYCGTIQTVPSRLKRVGAVEKVKTIHKPGPAAGGNGAGAGAEKDTESSAELNALADVVGSSASGATSGSGSGLAGSGLRSNRLRAETIAPEPPKWTRHRAALMVAAGAGAAMVLLVIVWSVLRDDSHPQPAAPIVSSTVVPPANQASAMERTVQPHFCGVPLAGEAVVVYVLDRGAATGEMFGYLKEAGFNSIDSLSDDQKFQVIFWDNGSGEVVFPADGPAHATPDNLDAARQALDDLGAHGRSDPTGALERAFRVKPSAVVIATGKAYELDDAFAATVQKLRQSHRCRVHTLALGPGTTGTLPRVAQQTGGQFRALSAPLLREQAR